MLPLVRGKGRHVNLTECSQASSCGLTAGASVLLLATRQMPTCKRDQTLRPNFHTLMYVIMAISFGLLPGGWNSDWGVTFIHTA